MINSLDKQDIEFPSEWDVNKILRFEQFVKKYIGFADFFVENDDDKEDNSIINIDIEKRTFRLSNYVGEIIFDNEIFHIYPFTFSEEAINSNPTKCFALFYQNLNLYLEESLQVKYAKLVKKSNHIDDTFLEILITVFVKELEDKLQDRPHYSYIEQEESLNKLVGRVNFSQYSNNYISGKKHILPCEYSIFSFNNSINKILKFTLNKLINISKNRDNLNHIKRFLVLFDEVDDISFKEVQNLFKTITFNQLNKDYKNLITLSKILLNGLNNDDSSAKKEGKELTNFCFLFKMNILFERFISARLNDYLRTNFADKGFSNFSQTTSKKLFKDLNKFPLKPDNLIKDRNNNTIAIIDTKYKVLCNFDIKNAKNSDLYQVAIYNLTYKSKLGILMYPLLFNEENTRKEELNFRTLNIFDSNFESKVAVISVPLIFKEEEIEDRNFKRLEMYFDLIFKGLRNSVAGL